MMPRTGREACPTTHLGGGYHSDSSEYSDLEIGTLAAYDRPIADAEDKPLK